MKSISNSKIILISFIAILILIYICIFKYGIIWHGGDSYPLFQTRDFLYKSHFLWSSTTMLGGLTPSALAVMLYPTLLIVEFFHLFGDTLGQYLFNLLLFVLSGVSLYYFFGLFFDYKYRIFGSIFIILGIGFWFIFARNLLFITYLFIFTPIIITLIVKYLNSNLNKYLYYLIILSCFNVAVVLNPWTFIIQGLIICGVMLYLSPGVLKWLLVYFAIYTLCIPGLVIQGTFFIYNKSISSDSWNNIVLLQKPLIEQQNTSALIYTLRGLSADQYGQWGYVNKNISDDLFEPYPLTSYLDSYWYKLVSWIPFIIFLIGLIFFKTRNYIYFTGILLVSLFLIKSSAAPFGDLFVYAINNISLFGVFRNPHQKFSVIYIVVITILIMMTLRSAPKIPTYVMSVLLLVYIVTFSWAYIPYGFIPKNNILTGNFPSSYEILSLKLKSMDIDRMVLYPKNDSTWTNLNFGYEGYHPLHYFATNIQIYNRNDSAFNPFVNKFYNEVYVNSDIDRAIKVYGVDAFILDGNTDRYARFGETIDMSNIQNLLSNRVDLDKTIIDNLILYNVIPRYRTPNLISDIVSADELNPVFYRIELSLESNEQLNFLQSFHPEWKLYLEPYAPLDCGSGVMVYSGTTIAHPSSSPILGEDETTETIGETRTGESYYVTECPSANRFYAGGELAKLWEKPIFDDTHKMVYDYANQWTIDPEYIRANYPKEYYHENPDGSIDVRMTMYFRPQSYFYLGLIISGLTLFGCVSYLVVSGVRGRCRAKKVDTSQEGI